MNKMINFEIAVKEHLDAHGPKIVVYALTLPLTYGRTDGQIPVLDITSKDLTMRSILQV